jgi:hypothetical protein
MECGIATTRYADGVITMKSNTTSNLVLTYSNLATLNQAFTINTVLSTSSSNIAHITNASFSSNLTATGTISTTSNIGIGTTTPRYGLEINKRLPNIGLVWGASNKGHIDFSYNSDPTISAGACARIEATDDVNYGGHLDFQNRTVRSASSNMNSRLFIKSSGLIGINNSNPTYQLDVNGTANVSATLTSATHSNSGNMQIGGSLSVNGTPSDMTRNQWNNARLGNWNITGSNYFLLATSPNSSAGNSAGGLRISGTMGGFYRGNLCQIDCTITCRDGVSFLGNGFGAIAEAQKWCNVIVYNSNNVQYQYLLSVNNQFSGIDLDVSCGDVGIRFVLQEPTATPYYTSLVFNTSNTSLGSVLSTLQYKTEMATIMTTISSNITVDGSFQSVSATISCNLSIGSNLSVSGTIYPTALSMSTNPLYIQNGNAGLTYANVSGTGQTMDGPALYGWQGGVIGYVGNGSNFAPGRNGINGTLFWNYDKVGIGKSNPAYTLNVNGTCVATMFAGNLGWGYLTSVPALCSNTSPQVLYGSNTASWSSNALASVATSANYV